MYFFRQRAATHPHNAGNTWTYRDKKNFFFKNRNKINMRRKRHYNIFCTRAVKVRSTVYFCYHIVLVCYVSGSDTGDNMGD